MAAGVKYDQGKPRLGLLPPHAIVAVARVLTNGSKKYADHNWKHVKDARIRYTDAALRHIFAYIAGEVDDPVDVGGDGENHLAHAICCLAFLLDADESGWEFPVSPPKIPDPEPTPQILNEQAK